MFKFNITQTQDINMKSTKAPPVQKPFPAVKIRGIYLNSPNVLPAQLMEDGEKTYRFVRWYQNSPDQSLINVCKQIKILSMSTKLDYSEFVAQVARIRPNLKLPL